MYSGENYSKSNYCSYCYFFFFSSRRRHTRLQGDWSSDVCSSDLFETVCSCHLSPPFHAPTHSNSLQPANENQACFLPIALGLPAGRALRPFPLVFLPQLGPQRVWTVFPGCWPRLVFSLRAIQPCRTCGSSPPDLPFGALPKYL